MYSPKSIANIVFSYFLVKFVDSAKRNAIRVVKTGQVPGHVGFIMDGNRTFAKKEGLSSLDGHTSGAKTLVNILRTCYDLGVDEISVYAFSIENFNRPQAEVDAIMNLLSDSLEKLSKESVENEYHVRIRVVGNRSLIKEDILQKLCQIEEETNVAEYKRCLNVCFPYTARDDMAHSIKSIASDFKDGKISKQDITEDTITSNLYVGDHTKPLDLLLRTSGHTRLSDFLLWESSAKCTINFSSTLWPEFGTLELLKTILEWSYDRDDTLPKAIPARESVLRVNHINLQTLPKPPSFASVAPSQKKDEAGPEIYKKVLKWNEKKQDPQLSENTQGLTLNEHPPKVGDHVIV